MLLRALQKLLSLFCHSRPLSDRQPFLESGVAGATGATRQVGPPAGPPSPSHALPKVPAPGRLAPEPPQDGCPCSHGGGATEEGPLLSRPSLRGFRELPVSRRRSQFKINFYFTIGFLVISTRAGRGAAQRHSTLAREGAGVGRRTEPEASATLGVGSRGRASAC